MKLLIVGGVAAGPYAQRDDPQRQDFLQSRNVPFGVPLTPTTGLGKTLMKRDDTIAQQALEFLMKKDWQGLAGLVQDGVWDVNRPIPDTGKVSYLVLPLLIDGRADGSSAHGDPHRRQTGRMAGRLDAADVGMSASGPRGHRRPDRRRRRSQPAVPARGRWRGRDRADRRRAEQGRLGGAPGCSKRAPKFRGSRGPGKAACIGRW